MIKVALKNGYTVYGRLIEENSSSIILVAQRELIPEMRISHIRCSKDIGEKIVIDRNQVEEIEEVSYDEMEFVGEPEKEWSFWLGFSEHLSAGQLFNQLRRCRVINFAVPFNIRSFAAVLQAAANFKTKAAPGADASAFCAVRLADML